jgi:hypothetical protein
MNPVALREDETAHLRVPATGLVSEVDTGLEEFVERGLRHGNTGWLVASEDFIAGSDRAIWHGTRSRLNPPER